MSSFAITLAEPPKRGASKALADVLREHVKSGRFRTGDRLPSMRDIMGQTQLGYTVVHRAVAMLAAEGMVLPQGSAGTLILGQGSATSQQSVGVKESAIKRIGVVLPFWALHSEEEEQLSHFAVGHMLNGIGRQADHDRCRLELIYSHGNEAAGYEFVPKIMERNLDGLIWLQPHWDHEANLSRLLHEKIPLVVTGRRFANLPLKVVHEDLNRLGELVADCFAQRGCKRILVLCGQTTDAYDTDRVAAVRAGLESRGISLPDDQVCPAFLNPSFPQSMQDLLVQAVIDKHPDFDGIFCIHPELLGPVAAMQDKGQKQCGKDYTLVHLATISLPVRQLWPRLPMTLIQIPMAAIGRAAVTALESQWGNRVESASEDLSPRLDAGLPAASNG